MSCQVDVPVPVRIPTWPRRAQRRPSSGCPEGLYATAVTACTPHEEAAWVSARVVVTVRQAARSPDVCSTRWPPWSTRASTLPVDPTARASGTAVNANGNSPGDHVAPSSALWATGENLSSSEIRNPTVSEPDGDAATTNPPLLATPGGVCSIHELLPAGRRKSSQNVFPGSWRWPMAKRTDEPVGVVVDALMGAVGGRTAPSAPPVVARTITAAATAASGAQRFTNA